MLVSIARISAILLWMPAIGLSILGDKMLSPYELLILLLLPVIALTSLEPRRLFFGLVALTICTISYSNSMNRSVSTVYYFYYVLIIIPHMLLFIQILEDDEAARAFIVSFVRTGVWMGPLAVLQFLSPFEISLINNSNYALQTGLHRAQLFAPEASILAALYVVAICLTIFNTFRHVEPGLRGDSLTYSSLLAGLATTVSTSALLVLPPLLLFIFRICGVSWKTLVKFLFIGGILLAIFFVAEYQDRVASGDSTSSALLRFASMLAGLQIVLQHWLTGLGLGMNKTVGDAVKLIYFAWTKEVVDKPGIDSFQLSLMAETGVFPGIISIAILIVCYRVVKDRLGNHSNVAVITAMMAICIWFVSLLTSGYRGLAHCWLCFPAGYVVYMRTRSHRKAASREHTVPTANDAVV